MYSEFRRRFEILAPSEHRIPSPVYDERLAVENLLENIDIEKTSYRMGLSQVCCFCASYLHFTPAEAYYICQYWVMIVEN